MAETAALHSLQLLLNPQRLNRLVEHHARDNQMPVLSDVLQQLWQSTWEQKHQNSYHNAVQQGINWVTLQQLLNKATDPQLAAITRAEIHAFLDRKQRWLTKQRNKNPVNAMALTAIKQHFLQATEAMPYQAPTIPPGSPIGN